MTVDETQIDINRDIEYGVIGEPGMWLPSASTNGGRVGYALSCAHGEADAQEIAEHGLGALTVTTDRDGSGG